MHYENAVLQLTDLTMRFFSQETGLKKSLPVIQWLASQANELGGYRSTQVKSNLQLFWYSNCVCNENPQDLLLSHYFLSLLHSSSLSRTQ